MNYIISMAGAFLMAFAVGNVLEPMNYVNGGVGGLAIIIKEISSSWLQTVSWGSKIGLDEGIPLWVTTLLLNVPLYLAAYHYKGSQFLKHSLWGGIWFTVFLAVIPELQVIPRDEVLNALFGGLIEGVGLGLVLLARASTGGGDLLATMLHDHFPQYSIPKIMACVDGIVVACGFAVFGIEKGLYALVTIFLIARVSDLVVGGFGHAMVAFIISDQPTAIARLVMKEIGRGITGIDVKGLYRDTNRMMLLCVASKKQMVAVKSLVYQTDPSAFVIITDARETLGEGFRALGNI